MEIIGHARGPVIISHSNPAAVWQHRRNVSDTVMKAVAATGGVVGINGLGHFLGGTSTETFMRHLDYAVQLVGPRHVGLGLDYVFDPSEMDEVVAQNPQWFPPGEGYGGTLEMVPPERMPEIVESMLRLGYAEDDVRAILGGNLLRVAREVWK